MAKPVALSTFLRQETRQAHRDSEAIFDIDARLTDRSVYGALLLTLRTFFGAAESALASVSGWDRLTPAVDLASRRRTELLEADLARLGLDSLPERDDLSAELVGAGELARGLGVLYVVQGSALGGKIVANRATATLGTDLPVSFFSSGHRPDIGSQWQALQRALDSFVPLDADVVRGEVVQAAIDTFVALGDLLAARTSQA